MDVKYTAVISIADEQHIAEMNCKLLESKEMGMGDDFCFSHLLTSAS